MAKKHFATETAEHPRGVPSVGRREGTPKKKDRSGAGTPARRKKKRG